MGNCIFYSIVDSLELDILWFNNQLNGYINTNLVIVSYLQIYNQNYGYNLSFQIITNILTLFEKTTGYYLTFILVFLIFVKNKPEKWL